VDTRRGLVAAMRDALEQSEAARKVDKIFEVESMICKPLHYVPGLDTAMTIIADGLDLGKRWLQRDRSRNEWFLLSAKMADATNAKRPATPDIIFVIYPACDAVQCVWFR
jgi:hypothetical protein